MSDHAIVSLGVLVLAGLSATGAYLHCKQQSQQLIHDLIAERNDLAQRLKQLRIDYAALATRETQPSKLRLMRRART